MTDFVFFTVFAGAIGFLAYWFLKPEKPAPTPIKIDYSPVIPPQVHESLHKKTFPLRNSGGPLDQHAPNPYARRDARTEREVAFAIRRVEEWERNRSQES